MPVGVIPDLGEKLSRIVDVATGNPLVTTQKLPERVVMTGAARTFWEPTYDALMTERHGLLGAVTARGATQVLRVALIYALLDGVEQMDVVHLKAALAVWNYCGRSPRPLSSATGSATRSPTRSATPLRRPRRA